MQRYVFHQIIQEAKEIQKQYPSTPSVKRLNRQQILSLNKEIKSFLELIDKANPDSFSFSQKYYSIKDDFKGFVSHYLYSSLEKSYRILFSFLDNAIIESYNKIQESDSVNPKFQSFEKFGKSEKSEFNRKKTLDFITQRISNPKQIAVRMEDSEWKDSLTKILGGEKQYKKDFEFICSHEQLQTSVTEEIIQWMENTKTQLIMENPFKNEEQYLLKLEKTNINDIIANFSQIEKEYKAIAKDVKIDFDFYRNQFTQKKNRPLIVFKTLISDMQKQLLLRRTAWEIKQIDEYRKKFMDELYSKIAQFQKLENVVSLFTNQFGVLWDLSQAPFNDYGFEVLKEFADILENEKGLQKLAELIGRHNKACESYHKEMISRVVTEFEYKPKPAYKGEISGLKLGNDITAVLPGELALYKNSKTKKLFMLKYAQKQLLSYSYQNMMPEGHDKRISEEVSVTEEENKGPIIICVDTSGSMNGDPERVAKTITFALTKKAIEEDRGCYLISFSTGIETVDLGLLSKSNAIQELINFLRMSFNGGTDAEPALRHSIELLNEKSWKNSDILMISDFCMGNLSYNLTEQINKQQDNGSKFFSLVIGDSGNESTIQCFDQNWAYDPYDNNSLKQLVKNVENNF